MLRACLIYLLVSTSPSFAADRDNQRSNWIDPTPEWGISGDARGSMLSSSSAQSGVSRRETAGPDTFAIYGGPDRPLEGRFEDGAGAPSWNGWTSYDQTDVPVYWHVDAFNAENLNSNGPGNFAMWSGQSFEMQPDWATAPGYGDNWNDPLIFESDPVTNPTQGQTVSLDFYFNHELEPGYDFFYVEYDSAGIWNRLLALDGTSKETSGEFAAPGLRFSEVTQGGIVYAGSDYGGELQDRIRIRLRVVTDGAWSDEDGLWNTAAGAVQVDDITVITTDGTYSEDFEGSAPYLFNPVKFPFAGDFADIHPAFLDVDPCRSNLTPVAGFLDYGQTVRNGPGTTGLTSTGGSTSPGVNYGVPGYWVTNYSGGLSLGEVSLRNAIVSPRIPWDLPGPEDDGVDVVGAFMRFDAWVDLPTQNGIFIWWDIWSAANGESPTRGLEFWFYRSFDPLWKTYQFDLTRHIVPDAEWVQVQLWAADMADVWGYPGTAATPSPLYDNVSVYKYRLAGPQLEADPHHLLQDSFSSSGATSVTTSAERDQLDVRADMASDVNSGLAFLVPGDSIAIGASARIPGTTIQDLRMFWALKTNPLFEDAIRSAPQGPKHQNVTAGPAGTVWSGEVLADTCYTRSGFLARDRFFFDLPDVDFMYPGDVIQYYFQATDTDGRISTLPSDLTGFASFDRVYTRYGTAYALPSLRDSAGSQAPILVLNDRGNEVEFPELHQSMAELGKIEGVDFDIYWKRAPSSSPNSNGIGTGGAHGANVQQLEGYSTILYFGGSTNGIPLADGQPDGYPTKANDIALLEDWHELPGRRSAAYFGDTLAQKMTMNAGSIAYLNNTMGVIYEGPSVVPFLGGSLAPVVRPQQASFEVEYVTYFNCQTESPGQSSVGVLTHSHITPGVNSLFGHMYVDPVTQQAIDTAAASVIHPNLNPDVTGYDVTFPYSFPLVYSPTTRAVGFSQRTGLLKELLDLFAEDTTQAPVGASTPARGTLELRVSPNPFNPNTVVSFDVRVGQRGSVKVYNLRGELVRALHDGKFPSREFDWDGTDDRGATVASGVYIVRATADGEVRIAKTALVR